MLGCIFHNSNFAYAYFWQLSSNKALNDKILAVWQGQAWLYINKNVETEDRVSHLKY